MTSTSVQVGLAEIQIVKGVGTFQCSSIGSCVAVCAIDPKANIGGCANLALPKAIPGTSHERPAKFANTGVRELINMMERMGADRTRISAVLVGGADTMVDDSFETANLRIGTRNVSAAEEALAQQGVSVVAKDVGGEQRRGVTFVLESGQVLLKTPLGERNWVNLRS